MLVVSRRRGLHLGQRRLLLRCLLPAFATLENSSRSTGAGRPEKPSGCGGAVGVNRLSGATGGTFIILVNSPSAAGCFRTGRMTDSDADEGAAVG